MDGGGGGGKGSFLGGGDDPDSLWGFGSLSATASATLNQLL